MGFAQFSRRKFKRMWRTAIKMVGPEGRIIHRRNKWITGQLASRVSPLFPMFANRRSANADRSAKVRDRKVLRKGSNPMPGNRNRAKTIYL